MDLPAVGLLRDVQPSHVDRQRIVQAEEHADEDVGPELPLNLDHLQLQGLEILRIDLGIKLIEKVPLVADEERHGDAVRHLAAQHRQEPFAGVHRLRASCSETIAGGRARDRSPAHPKPRL